MDSADGLALEGEKEDITCPRQSATVTCASARYIARPKGWSKTEPN
jgi:hypothetical protein